MSLKAFSASLRELPKVLAIRIAARCAVELTELAKRTFDAGTDPYGTPWVPSADGRDVTMRKTGALASGVRYVAVGEKLRLQLTTKYAKYQVGRRPVTPAQGAPLPTAYAEKLRTATQETIGEVLA